MTRSKQPRRGTGEAWPPRPGRASPVPPAGGTPRRQYSARERADLLRRWAQSGLTAKAFAAVEGMPSIEVLYAWRREAKQRKASAAGGPPNPSGRTRGPYAEVERVAAVSAYRSSGLTQRAFAAVWGLSIKTLSAWLSRVAREGDKGLATRKPGRPKGARTSPRPPTAVQAETLATARRFPAFGLKQVSQYLFRFAGLSVSPRTVARTAGALGPSGLPGGWDRDQRIPGAGGDILRDLPSGRDRPGTQSPPGKSPTVPSARTGKKRQRAALPKRAADGRDRAAGNAAAG